MGDGTVRGSVHSALWAIQLASRAAFSPCGAVDLRDWSVHVESASCNGPHLRTPHRVCRIAPSCSARLQARRGQPCSTRTPTCGASPLAPPAWATASLCALSRLWWALGCGWCTAGTPSPPCRLRSGGWVLDDLAVAVAGSQGSHKLVQRRPTRHGTGKAMHGAVVGCTGLLLCHLSEPSLPCQGTVGYIHAQLCTRRQRG